MRHHINTHCNTELFSLNNLMNVLKNFDYLGHYYDFLYDLLEDVWDFNKMLFFCMDGHWGLFESINNLQDLLNVIDVFNSLPELL